MSDSTEEASDAIQKLFAGSLEDLPQQESNVVRVFLSSTFTDHEHERNLLTNVVSPWLRKYCWERGLIFQMVDMRWGVTDDASAHQRTNEIVMEEIHKCRNISRGPFFLAFLGDRYGSRFFPRVIEASEFETLLRAARTACRETALLETWYVKDRNAVPPEYILQPITSYFPHYYDDAPQNLKKRNQDRTDWNAVSALLGTLLKMAANVAVGMGAISRKASWKYFISVTEDEVRTGIFEPSDADERTLCFIRDFEGPPVDITHEKAGRFTDLESKRVDQEAAELLKQLKEVSLPQHLTAQNIFKYKIPWTKIGIDPERPEHALYLHQLETAVLLHVEHLIDDYKKESLVPPTKRQIYEEVLHHSIYCSWQNKVFCNREDILTQVREVALEVHHLEQETVKDLGVYLQTALKDLEFEDQHMNMAEDIDHENDRIFHFMKHDKELPLKQYHKPVIIYGLSGSGKTALMAHIHQRSARWFLPKAEPVRIVRFIGITRHSCSLRSLILSTCQQIWENYPSVSRPTLAELERDGYILYLHFQTLLLQLDTSEHPLIIVWDGLEKLQGVADLRWMPLSLPPGVHIIVTTASDSPMLEYARQILPDSNVILIPVMSWDTAARMLTTLLKSAGRQLTKPQKEVVLGAYKLCSQPLFMKLAFETSRLWTSFLNIDKCTLGLSIKSAIELLLQRMEKAHGIVLVSRSLALMTISREGLSDSEMEDVLSLDDEVLQNVYIYHLPPNPLFIRLPQLLWQRLRYDLVQYMVQRRVHNSDVNTWQHRQFRDAVLKRYVTSGKQNLHRALAEYFSGTWSEKVKPLKLIKNKKADYPRCTRGAPQQPIYFTKTHVNARKVVELPLHFLQSQMHQEYVRTACCCIKWLNASVEVLGAIGTVQVIQEAHSQVQLDIDLAKEQLEELRSVGNKLMLIGNLDEPSAEAVQLEKDVTRTEGELRVREICLQDISQVLDIIIISLGVLSTNPQSLALQILGMFGEDELPSECLQQLKRSCCDLVQSTKMLMLVPITRCFPRPGCLLKMQIDVVFSFKNDDVLNEKRFHVSSDGKILLGLQRQRAGGDLLKQFDLVGNTQVKDTQILPGLHVKCLELHSNDRFLSLEAYCKEAEGGTKTLIFDTLMKQQVTLPAGTSLPTFSETGRFTFVIQDPELIKEEEEEEREKCKRKTGKDEGLLIGSIYEMRTGLITKLRLSTIIPVFTHAAIFSPNDSTVVLNTSDGFQHAYAVESARLKSSFGPSREGKLVLTTPVKNVMHFLPRNRFLSPGISSSNSSSLFVHNFSAAETVAEFKAHKKSITLVVTNQDQTLSASSDGQSIVIWDLEKYRQLSTCPMSASFVSFCGMFDNLLLSGNLRDGAPVSVWHYGSRQKPLDEAVAVHTLAGQKGVVFLQSVLSKGIMISVSLDNCIKIWDLHKVAERCNQMIEKAESNLIALVEKQSKERQSRPRMFGEGNIATTCTALSQCGQVACVGTDDGWLIFFCLQSMCRLSYHKQEATILLSSQSGERFISSSSCIKVWSMDGKETRELYKNDEVPCCAVERNDVAAFGYKDYARLWNILTGEQVGVIKGFSFNVIDLTQDASKILCTAYDAPIIVSVESKEALNMVPPSSTAVATCAAISPGDKMAASGTSEGSIRVVLVDSGKGILSVRQAASVLCLGFMSKRPWLLTGANNQVNIWSLHTGVLLHSLTRHNDFITRIIVSSHEDHFVTTGRDKQIIVWDAKDLSSLTTLRVGSEIGKTLSVTKDLGLFVYGSVDVSHIAVLQPNPALASALNGHLNEKVPGQIQYAQAYALSFSSQKITARTSAACIIL